MMICIMASVIVLGRQIGDEMSSWVVLCRCCRTPFAGPLR